MSNIERITVQAYAYQLDDTGPVTSNRSHGPTRDLSNFVVTIETDDGLAGCYAPHWGGSSGHALAQVREMARGLIGQDAERREQIFERLKNAYRHYDKVGIAALDTALWDLAGKKYGVPVSKLLGGYR